MAKVQGKKVAVSARRASSKVAARVKRVARVVKKRIVAKPASSSKTARKPIRSLKVVPPKLSKVASTRLAKVARLAKVRPAKLSKPVKRAAAALPARPLAVRPVVAKPLAAALRPSPAAAPVPDKKTRTRRPRPRVQSNGAPVANWLPPGAVKPRSSSFIPAPPRAEAPSLIAAPPASSDRLIRPEDVTEFVTRTVPVRVDVEQSGGRLYITVNPEEVILGPGEGIEWDFRYLGGADISVEELVVEFEKPSPFSQTSFKSRKPGAARPHRQLSGAVHKSAAGKRVRYAIKAITPFKTELAAARPYITVQ